MRTCPQCHAEYADDMRFCLHDGVALAEPIQYQKPTESFTGDAFSGPEVVPQPTIGMTEPRIHEPTTQTIANPTVAVSGLSPRAQGKKPTYLFVVVAGIFLVGVFLLVVVVAGAWYFLISRGSEVATANTNTNRSDPGNANRENTNSSSTNGSNSDGLNGVFNANSDVKTDSNTPATANANSTGNRSAPPTPSKKNETKNAPTVEDPPPITERPTPRPNVPKTISGGVLNGRAISLPRPPYPPAARAVRASGPVSVQVLIDEDGRVISASAINGHPLLRSAAESAARGARFSPTMLSGQRVKVSGVITYNFVP